MSGRQNRHYHDFYEGYTEHYEVRPDGRRRIRRVYTGKLYEQDFAKPRKLLYRCAYSAALALSAACFLFAATTVSKSNLTWISAIPTLISVFLYLWSAVSMLYYYSLRPRTIYEYRTSHGGLVRSSLCQAVCHGISIAVHLVLMAVGGSLSSAPEHRILLLLAVSAGLMLAVYFAESKCRYRTVDAEGKEPI